MKQTMTSYLPHIRIVMVETTLPANIGSAARALHTMGLSDLVVVNPRLPIDESSVANAAGAQELLANTRITATLDEALSDCTLIFAASARSRQMPRPVVTPAFAAMMMAQHLSVQDASSDQSDDAVITPRIAILFGRENHGLNNDELAKADYHIQIPANPAYPVLNVASAIQVIASNIYAQFSNPCDDIAQANSVQGIYSNKQTQGAPQITHPLDITIRGQWDEPAISHAQAMSLNAATIDLLKKLNLAHDDDLKHLPYRLSRLSSRLQLDQKEYALIRALIAKVDKLVDS